MTGRMLASNLNAAARMEFSDFLSSPAIGH